MNYLSIIRTRASIAALTAAVALLSLAPGVSAASVAHTTVDSAQIGGVSSIIMRDGGVCDPIRHMGC